jgi:hypothetical protein
VLLRSDSTKGFIPFPPFCFSMSSPWLMKIGLVILRLLLLRHGILGKDMRAREDIDWGWKAPIETPGKNNVEQSFIEFNLVSFLYLPSWRMSITTHWWEEWIWVYVRICANMIWMQCVVFSIAIINSMIFTRQYGVRYLWWLVISDGFWLLAAWACLSHSFLWNQNLLVLFTPGGEFR